MIKLARPLSKREALGRLRQAILREWARKSGGYPVTGLTGRGVKTFEASYKGKKIEQLSHEELYQALKELGQLPEEAR